MKPAFTIKPRIWIAVLTTTFIMWAAIGHIAVMALAKPTVPMPSVQHGQKTTLRV